MNNGSDDMKRKETISTYSDQQMQDRRILLMLRNWAIVIAAILLIVGAVFLVRSLSTRGDVVATRLPCSADQDVTVFGDNVLYYDGVSIHCLSTSGSIRWSFTVGGNARFSVSDTNLVIWSGTQLFIVDKNGRPSYNEDMSSPVQFARVGSNYCAVVIGDDTHPELLIKNLDGTQVDSEIEAFSGLMMLDVGFYGDHDQYLWTLSLDVYGVNVNTVLNTMQVNRMNSGIINLGEDLAYKVLFEDGRLRVFTTRQMYTYDYKAVQDMSRTQLVYGWEVIGCSVPQRGPASMLLAPTSQMSGSMTIKELRVLTDSNDRRYTLTTDCIGAAIDKQNIYAFSGDHLYCADVSAQRFSAYPLRLTGGVPANSLVGLTRNGRAILLCNDQVYAVTLPQ